MNNLIESLRKMQIDWELDLPRLSKISHIDENTLQKFLLLPNSEIEALPSIPAGLENAVALVSVFIKIQRTFPALEKQNEWLTRENSVFEGNKPIEVMAMSPAHVAFVSYALESAL